MQCGRWCYGPGVKTALGGGLRTPVTGSCEYQDTTWADAAKDKNAWEKLDGKRVALKVVIRSTDNQWMLSDAPQETFTVFTVTGPEGIDSGGLPLRAYVKKGGKAERMVRQAKGYSTGAPEQWHVIKGIARTNKADGGRGRRARRLTFAQGVAPAGG